MTVGATAVLYDREADWHLLNTCNYRCRYCFFPPDMLGGALKTYATIPDGAPVRETP